MQSLRLSTIVLLFLLLIGIFFAGFFIPVEYGESEIFVFYPYKAYSKFDVPNNEHIEDILTLYYPVWRLGMESLKDFTLPLWDPYKASGTPLWASGHSFFLSPLNIISFIIPHELAYRIIIIAWFLLSGIFTYYFCRDIGLTDRGSVIASIVFMFASTPFYHLYQLDYASIMAFFPLVLWRTERLCSTNNYKASIVMGVVYGVMLLSSSPQFSFYIIISSLFYYCWSIFTSDEDRRIRVIFSRGLKFLIALLIGIGLSSVEILPFLSFASYSQRTGTGFLSENYLSPLTILNMFFPRITNIFLIKDLPFGFLGTAGILKKLTYMPGRLEMERIYYGIVPLGFIIAGILSRAIDNKKIKFFLYYGIGNIMFLLLLSLNTFHSIILSIAPSFDGVYAPRMLIITAISFSLLSGYGFDIINNGKYTNVFRKFLVIILFLYISLFFAIKIPLWFLKEWVISIMSDMGRQFFPTAKDANYFDIAELFYNKIDNIVSITTPDIFIPFMIILITLLILPLLKKSKTLFFPLILTIIIFDLFSFHFSWVKRGNPEFKYYETESMKFLKDNAGIYRIFGLSEIQNRSKAELNQMIDIPHLGLEKIERTVFPSNFSMMYGLHDIRVRDSLHIKRYDRFMNLLEGNPITDTFGNNDTATIEPKNYQSGLLNLLNVKYILTNQSLDSSNLKLVFDKDIKIYENVDVLPKAFFVTDFIVEKDEKRIFDILSDDKFNPLKTVILEKEPLISVEGKKSNGEQDSSHYDVKIINYAINEVKIDVKNLKKGFLVLCDSYYPGWNAYVDGRYVEVMQANYMFRAIPISAGEHQVRFVYEPRSFRMGAIVTSGTLVLVIVSLSALHIRKRFK